MMKLGEEGYRRLAYFFLFIRLFFGPFIFISVWPATLITFFVDYIDGYFYKKGGFNRKDYNSFDKSLDYYWYSWVMAYIFVSKAPNYELLIGLFLLRSAGQILYFLTRNEVFFFIFPNIFEWLFFFYLFTLVYPQYSLYLYFPKIISPLIVITSVTLIKEYIIHIWKANLSGIFGMKKVYFMDDPKKK